VTNISLQKLNVTTATKSTSSKASSFETIHLILYKGILFDANNSKIYIFPYCSIQIIVDKIKVLFGLESLDRECVILPSQELRMIESHSGIERSLEESEVNCYEVFKIRFFRWLIGLPNSHPKVDILVRISNGRKTYISFKDNEIDYSRSMNISIPEEYDIKAIFKEMMLGIESISDIKEALNDIITRVDKSFIYLSSAICFKINEYGLL
jgi:hypothetical protein